MASATSQDIDERNGGCGVVYDVKLYVWGGVSVDRRYPYQELSDSDDSDEDEDDAIDKNFCIETVVTLPRPNDPDHPFDVFDLIRKSWYRQPTRGSFPSLGLGSSIVVHYPSHSFFLYSGWNDENFDSEVYRISPDNWTWEILEPATDMKPSPRYLTGLVVHDNRLCMFGGVGVKIVDNQNPGAEYEAYEANGDVHPFGWNNEYYEFIIQSRTWIAPPTFGSRPPPIGTFAFSKIDRHRAMLFGGRGSEGYVSGRRDGRTNKAYIIDLDTRVWTGIFQPSNSDQMWPAPRRFATLTPLVDPELVGDRLCGCGPVLKQRMLLLWGKDSHHHICPETWILDNETFTWTLLNIQVTPRSWHVAQPLYTGMSTECRVAVFGGNIHARSAHYGDRVNTADFQLLSFGVRTLANICLSAIVRSEQVMASVPSLPPTVQIQVNTAYQAHIRGPPEPQISHAL